jgi:hypothetical protein
VPLPKRAEIPVKAPTPPATSTPAPTPAYSKKPESAPPTTPPSTPLTETAAADGTPLAPTIINGPQAPRAKDEPEQTTSAAPVTTSALADSKDWPAVVAEAPRTEAAPPAQEGEGKSIVVTLVDGLGKSVSPALLGVGGVTMLGLLALLFAYRRDHAQPGSTLARDIAAVSLDGRTGGRKLIRAGRSLAPVASSVPPQTPAPQPAGLPANWGDAIPRTRHDALQVLGMGVTPEVGDAAIKKIVDGLRLTWHPDHAKSAQDRELRELRMKQINAAWEIITGKRAG